MTDTLNMTDKYRFNDLPEIFEKLKSRLRIAVIHGGDKTKENAVMYKTHNPRSWKSYEVVANDIANALRETGFKNIKIMPDDMTMLSNIRDENIHFVWLNTAGVQGYIPTAHAAAMLEMAGVPYIGHNPQNAAILDNKHIFKYMLQKFNIATSPFVVWSRSSINLSLEEDVKALKKVFGDYTGPFIVKPVSGRASLNVTYVESLKELHETVDRIYGITQNLIAIEKYLSGREYCVSICGPVISQDNKFRNLEKPFAFSIIERILDKDELIFTSMDKKPITESRLRNLDEDKESGLTGSLRKMAQEVYTKFFLETLVRIDIRADEKGNLFALEANPKPDLKKPTENVTSLTCMGLSRLGMSYNDLITGLFIDRLDYLLKYRKKSIGHIIELLN
jgi:D-alanine-D-alanine ligase